MRWFCVALLACAVGASAAWAESLAAPAAGDEQGRLLAERQRLERAQAAEEAECRQRFAVTDCVQAVKRRYRPLMTDLRRQQNALNDQRRKGAAAERMGAQESRNTPEAQADAERRRQDALADQARREARAAEKAQAAKPAVAASASASASVKGNAAVTPPTAGPSTAAPAASAPAIDPAREREAQQRRDRVRERLSRQAASKPALPTPP